MLKFIKLWLPVILWAAFIFYLSGIPDLKSNFASEIDFILRKLAHMTVYFILTFFIRRAFQGSFHLNSFYLFVYPVILAVLYAISDEFHQTFIPHRHGCFQDVLIDSVGIFGFYIFVKVLSGYQRRCKGDS